MTATVDTMELDVFLAALREQLVSGEMTFGQLRWYSNLTKEQRNALVEDEADEKEQPSTFILRRLSSESLVVAATDGTETIPAAKDVFTGHIDPDFVNCDADEASSPTPERPVEVYEMIKDATFRQMFGSLSVETGHMCMTQSQIIRFCKDHQQYLRIGGYATFFLFKSKGDFFVAYVLFYGDDRLKVNVRRFASDYVWRAGVRNRVVVPQL